jgi:PIN domain nuclease of toxin-antitoxin system
VSEPELLSPKLMKELLAKDTKLFVSIASYWELKIKESLGRLEVHSELINETQNQGIELINVRPEDCNLLPSLPFHHRDPFDRQLICQAVQQQMVFATANDEIARYKDFPGLYLLMN